METGKNPAEFMLERVGPAQPESDPEYVDYAGAYKNSQMCADVEAVVKSVQPGLPLVLHTRYAASAVAQLYMSTVRWYCNYWRNVGYNLTRTALVTVVALVYSLSARGTPISAIKTQSQLQSSNGAIFASLFFSSVLQVRREHCLILMCVCVRARTGCLS
jgi:hypothetical protein